MPEYTEWTHQAKREKTALAWFFASRNLPQPERTRRWKEFCAIHASRPPGLVRKMEAEQGLL